MSVPIRGGPVVTLARLPFDFQELIVIPTSIVFPDPTGNGRDQLILSVPIRSGSPVTLATVPNGVAGFGADDQNVYFIDEDGTKSVALSGGEVHVVTDTVTSSTASGLGVVGSNLIVPCCGSAGAVQSSVGNILGVPLDGGPPTTVATGQPNASFPLACGSDICWWAGEAPFSYYRAAADNERDPVLAAAHWLAGGRPEGRRPHRLGAGRGPAPRERPLRPTGA
jgi:hypothetical protein